MNESEPIQEYLCMKKKTIKRIVTTAKALALVAIEG